MTDERGVTDVPGGVGGGGLGGGGLDTPGGPDTPTGGAGGGLLGGTDEGGSVGDRLGRDPGNLGDEVGGLGDVTFPTPQPAEGSM